MGRGFGELIRPVAFDGMCPEWHTLPRNSWYLAASITDLKNIARYHGNGLANPPQPVRGLVWHCPGRPVASCKGQCKVQGLRNRIRMILNKHNDPVQVFYSEKWKRHIRPGGPQNLPDTGAVVFGLNFSWPHRWGEKGDADLEQWDYSVDLTDEDADEEMIDAPDITVSGSASSSSPDPLHNSTLSGLSPHSDSTAATSLFLNSGTSRAQIPEVLEPQLSDMGSQIRPQPSFSSEGSTRRLRKETRRVKRRLDPDENDSHR
jgi:hypothetical protein